MARSPAPPYTDEGPHALWHVSEEPDLDRFEPRPAARIGLERRADGTVVPVPTGDTDEPLVWAVDTRHLPLFWFPRDCPRGCFWAGPATTGEDVDRYLGGVRSRRVHVIEEGWLDRVASTVIYAYRMPEQTFRPHTSVGGYWVSEAAVRALERVHLGDLVARHERAGIELRVLPTIWPLWDDVVASSLEFSGSRLRNAAARPT